MKRILLVKIAHSKSILISHEENQEKHGDFSLDSQSSKFAQQLHLKEIPNLLGGMEIINACERLQKFIHTMSFTIKNLTMAYITCNQM